MSFVTEQEEFWAGKFGDEYTARSDSEARVASNIAMFARSLQRAGPIESCLELGANIGMNLRALKQLYPDMRQHAVEINPVAAAALVQLIGEANVFCGSVLECPDADPVDLAFTKGVLIHIPPDQLSAVYEKLYRASRRWLLVADPYNPTPVAIRYRGHENRLFKRDFAGDLLDAHADLRLIDYGFVYRRDPAFSQDDLTWFLLEKHEGAAQ